MTRRSWSLALSHLGRIGLLGGSALALVASTQEGERAGTGGECPAGETCSSDTPDGLLFEGAPLGYWPVLTAHTIAAGGRQTFRIIDNTTHQELRLPFTAKTTSDAHQVVAIATDRAVVDATAAAVGHLRILAPTGELYDRMPIASAEVASMRVAPVYAASHPQIDPPRWASYAGGRAMVSVVLASTDGDLLVDENLAIRASSPGFERIGWDSMTLTPQAAGTVELAVDAGHLVDSRVRFNVVGAFDDVAISAPRTTGIGGDIVVCFSAWLRDSSSVGDTLVVGVPWQFRVTGPATPLTVQRYGACVELHTDSAGQVVVSATGAGRTWDATVDVYGARSRQRSAVNSWLWAPTEGDRAALAAQ